MATPTAPPVTPKTTTSTDPLYKLAVAQAQAAETAAAAPIQQQQQQSDAYFQQRQADAGANAAALSSLLKGIGPSIQSTYTTAAQNDELAGAGFSQGMQDALKGNTDNLNAMLAKLGSPAQLDSHAQEAGDVAYGLGGYIPGKTLTEQGAGFAAAADLLPANALLQGQQTAKQLGIQSASAHQQFANDLATLAGKLPGDIESNYQKLQSIALDNKKFALAVQKQKFDQAAKIAAQKLAVAKYNTGVDEFNARQKMTAAKFAYQQQHDNAQLAAEWARIGISQRSLQLRISQNAFKQANGGYTAGQIARFSQKLDALVSSSNPTRPVNGVMPTPQYQDKNGKWHDITPDTAVPSGAKTRNQSTYASFITAALRKGVPIQMALQRADTLFPETQRSLPPSLMQLPQVAAEAAKQAADYNKTTGVTLGTSPNGTPITWSAPKNLTAKGKQQVSGILNLASEYLGTPYAWGGTSPTGFDCSGLAQYIYGKEGISIPRTTYDQFKTGLSVPKGQLQAGDLVFFQGSDGKNGLPGHVGIYIGSGKFVEAPHTGDVVKVSTLAGYPGYMGARRYVH